MSELQAYYESVCIGYWAHPKENRCPCKGSGWFVSEVDTFHKCRYHYKGQPNNEDSEEVWNEWISAQEKLQAEVDSYFPSICSEEQYALLMEKEQKFFLVMEEDDFDREVADEKTSRILEHMDPFYTDYDNYLQ